DLYVPVTIAGIEWEGTAYRMDSVPIRMRKVVEPPESMLNDVEFLEMVIEKVEEM
ncbi:TPA: formylmethanofuran dehydrogenase subunit B, partial [Methanopyrus kandleri]|nr:formylmethanofuran dehydrogenase subunit B [Methanopyrus kandleri]